jgi:6-phosphogluconolactonase
MFLGIGKDGHTASLFPNSITLDNTVDLVVYDEGEYLSQPRISLSLNCLNDGKVKIFGIGDEEKAAIVEKALSYSTAQLPLSMLDFRKGSYYFITK